MRYHDPLERPRSAHISNDPDGYSRRTEADAHQPPVTQQVTDQNRHIGSASIEYPYDYLGSELAEQWHFGLYFDDPPIPRVGRAVPLNALRNSEPSSRDEPQGGATTVDYGSQGVGVQQSLLSSIARPLEKSTWERTTSPTPSFSQLRYPSYIHDPTPEREAPLTHIVEEIQDENPAPMSFPPPISVLARRLADAPPLADPSSLFVEAAIRPDTLPLMTRLGESSAPRAQPTRSRARGTSRNRAANQQQSRSPARIRVDTNAPSSLEMRFTESPLSPSSDKLPLAQRMNLDAQDSQRRQRPQNRNSFPNQNHSGYRLNRDDRDVIPRPTHAPNNGARTAGGQPRRQQHNQARNTNSTFATRMNDHNTSTLEHRIK